MTKSWDPSNNYGFDFSNNNFLNNNYTLGSMTKNWDPSNNYKLGSMTKSLDPSNNYTLGSMTKSWEPSNNYSFDFSNNNLLNNNYGFDFSNNNTIANNNTKNETLLSSLNNTNDILSNLQKKLEEKAAKESLEGFDLLGLEDRMKRGKQSNFFQLGNLYNNNSINVIPYEESFFSPFHR